MSLAIERIYLDQGHPNPLPEDVCLDAQRALERPVDWPGLPPVWHWIGWKRLPTSFHREDFPDARDLLLAVQLVTRDHAIPFNLLGLASDLRECNQGEAANRIKNALARENLGLPPSVSSAPLGVVPAPPFKPSNENIHTHFVAQMTCFIEKVKPFSHGWFYRLNPHVQHALWDRLFNTHARGNGPPRPLWMALADRACERGCVASMLFRSPYQFQRETPPADLWHAFISELERVGYTFDDLCNDLLALGEIVADPAVPPVVPLRPIERPVVMILRPPPPAPVAAAPPPARPLPADEEAKPGEKACIICYTHRITVFIVDCGHACLCSGCASAITTCPTCRAPITQKLPFRFDGMDVEPAERPGPAGRAAHYPHPPNPPAALSGPFRLERLYPDQGHVSPLEPQLAASIRNALLRDVPGRHIAVWQAIGVLMLGTDFITTTYGQGHDAA